MISLTLPLNQIWSCFSANAEIESAKRSGDAEVTVLRAQMKKAEMKISSLEKDLEQKVSLFKSYIDVFSFITNIKNYDGFFFFNLKVNSKAFVQLLKLH